MAHAQFLLQALTGMQHSQEVLSTLALPRAERVVIAVAYVREAAVQAIEGGLRSVGAFAHVYVGIRNDLTSVQAIARLLATQVKVFAVDTACREIIFHPKVYLAASRTRAIAVVGSANLTTGGLFRNIEASIRLELSLAEAQDRLFVDHTFGHFETLRKHHPSHIFQIRDDQHAIELLEMGRIADESVCSPPTTAHTASLGRHDNLAPMALGTISPADEQRRSRLALAKAVGAARRAPGIGAHQLVWTSRPLHERDLNVPSREGTNPTGSMGLKKGELEGVDHRHYFRNEVFNDLQWMPDRRAWERAEARFILVIKSVNVGAFTLKLSHLTDTGGATYRQRNFMTQLHWGEAITRVARRDLIGRRLRLYRRNTKPPEFLIEID